MKPQDFFFPGAAQALSDPATVSLYSCPVRLSAVFRNLYSVICTDRRSTSLVPVLHMLTCWRHVPLIAMCYPFCPMIDIGTHAEQPQGPGERHSDFCNSIHEMNPRNERVSSVITVHNEWW